MRNSEKKLVAMWRGSRLAGSPYMLPPGTPKDRVEVLEDAFRKTYRDAEFRKDFLKLVGDDADPIMPEELAKVIREIPRDAEVVDLLRSLAGARPLPSR